MKKKQKDMLYLPCAICGSARHITEIFLPSKYSFLYCDKCKIGAEAGKNSEVAVVNWNMLMQSKPQTYFDWLEEHADLEDKWCRS